MAKGAATASSVIQSCVAVTVFTSESSATALLSSISFCRQEKKKSQSNTLPFLFSSPARGLLPCSCVCGSGFWRWLKVKYPWDSGASVHYLRQNYRDKNPSSPKGNNIFDVSDLQQNDIGSCWGIAETRSEWNNNNINHWGLKQLKVQKVDGATLARLC